MRDVQDRLFNFWTLQAVGWGAYGLAVFLATLPYLSDRNVVVYRSAFTVCCFGATFILHPVCRKLWRCGTPLARSFLIVLLCCYPLGYVCGAVALALYSRFGMVPHPFSWRESLTGATPISNGFVLLSWCSLYFGIKYYQALEVERHRTMLAEASAREAELRALRYQIHPHFLFNTLNAISTLVIQGQRTAAVSMISRLAEFSRAVAANLDGLIFTFAFDRTVRQSFIEDTRQVMESSGGEILFVALRCSMAELERRIEDPSRQGSGKLSSAERFRELKEAGAFVDPGIPTERLVIDTTELSASDAASLIAGKLGL